MPLGLWGGTVHGIAPTVLGKLRTLLLRAAFPNRYKGVSKTTAIQVHFGRDADPGVYIPAQTVLGIVKHLSADHPRAWSARAGKAWGKTADRTVASNRWSKVTGPIAACQAYLRDIGWSPNRPSIWHDSAGSAWVLDGTAPLHEAKLALMEEFDSALWKRSSEGHLGSGTEHGLCLDIMRPYHVKLQKSDPRAARDLSRIWCGGVVV